MTERRFMRWFRIRRADDHPGVTLAVHVPGYLTGDQAHPTQDAALRAARRIYADYRDMVRTLSDRPEQQED